MSVTQIPPPGENALTLLEETALLKHLSPELRRAVAAEVIWLRLRGGDILFRESDPGDSLYVLVTDRLHVRGRSGQHWRT